MQLVVVYEVFYKRKFFIDQFCSGLDVFGMLNFIRSNFELMQLYFVYNIDILLMLIFFFNQFYNIDKVEDGIREVMR